MRLNSIFFIFFLICLTQVMSAMKSEADTLPYFYEIPVASEMYNAASVSARMVDGLGFRYYWATQDLRSEDLVYDPGNEGQTCFEVLEHLLGLSRFILITVKKEVHDNSNVYPDLTWEEQRKETLENLQEASEILKDSVDVSELNIVFKRGEKTSEFPFWNLINGPISDAIYHVGQIVSYRRSTGNPINPNISQFQGKVKP